MNRNPNAVPVVIGGKDTFFLYSEKRARLRISEAGQRGKEILSAHKNGDADVRSLALVVFWSYVLVTDPGRYPTLDIMAEAIEDDEQVAIWQAIEAALELAKVPDPEDAEKKTESTDGPSGDSTSG